MQCAQGFSLSWNIGCAFRTLRMEQDRRERRTKLMRCIRHEAFLRLDRFAEAGEQSIDARRQDARFPMHSALWHRRKIALPAGFYLGCQIGQGFQTSRHALPGEQECDGQKSDLRCSHAKENLAGQCCALHQRLSHLHGHSVVAEGGCRACRHQAHALTIDRCIGELNSAERRRRRVGQHLLAGYISS